jgi:hypothetical protein
VSGTTIAAGGGNGVWEGEEWEEIERNEGLGLAASSLYTK